MFRITPVTDPKMQAEISAACGVPCVADAFTYRMIDAETGELMGLSQFEINAGYGVIYYLAEVPEKTDFEAMFILGRATMDFIDRCGAHTCRANSDTASDRMLKCLGFKLTETGYVADMTGMFDGHCSGKPLDLENT